jgi:fatty aldehyde decarbonylase
MGMNEPESKTCCGDSPVVSGPDRIRREVAGQYDKYAKQSDVTKVGSFAEIAGYAADEIRSLPRAAVLNSLSCGDPVRLGDIRPGQTVLDLGCGAGIDAILAARRVGPAGKVIGVDLSVEMLGLARANVREARVENVELFAAGMEFLPVESNTVDWIISNCAVNLSPEKDKVMSEMARVLRPDGRMLLSDLVAEELPEWVRTLSWNFITCLGLSISEREYRDLLRAHGFTAIRAINRFVYGAAEMQQLLDNEYREIKAAFSEEELLRLLRVIEGKIVKIDWQISKTDRDDYQVVPFEQKVADQGYRDLLCYITSNTIAGEIMGANNYMLMAAATEDFVEKNEFVKDAANELRHVEMLASLGKRFDFPVEQAVVEPQWKNIHRSLKAAADKGDIVACRLIQDLMAESQALVLYRFMSGFQSEVDEQTSKVANAILEDEMAHMATGIEAIRGYLASDPEDTHDKLIWAHHRVMPEFFGLIRYGCESLCQVLGLECGSLNLDAFKADLDELRINALDSYVEMLEQCGFDSNIVASLIASMGAYHEQLGEYVLNPGTCTSAEGAQSKGRCCG